MTTLAIDTSSKACSCAVMQQGMLLAEGYINGGLTHSATLMRLVEHTLKTARITFKQIDRLAVSTGPGSYTGLRIGISAVKGMAAAYNTPCVGVSTLLSLAYNLLPYEGIVCTALDARVGQVFAALFKIENGNVKRLLEDDAITLETLGELLPENAMVCGDGAQLVCARFPEKQLILAPAALQFQRASSVAQAAESEGMSALPSYMLAANYYRKSQAEREREAKQEKPGGQQ